MTSPYKMFKSKQIDGDATAILDYVDFQIVIKHGGSGNKSFINAAQIKLKQFERRDFLANQGKLSEDAQRDLEKQKMQAMAELYADHIIVGWDNVLDESDKEMKFNRKNVIKLLTDLPDLFTDIINQSNDAAIFKEKEQDKEEENIKKS